MASHEMSQLDRSACSTNFCVCQHQIDLHVNRAWSSSSRLHPLTKSTSLTNRGLLKFEALLLLIAQRLDNHGLHKDRLCASLSCRGHSTTKKTIKHASILGFNKIPGNFPKESTVHLDLLEAILSECLLTDILVESLEGNPQDANHGTVP